MAPQQDGPSDSGDYRIEHDSMGEVRVPTWAKWRAQTQRAVENFPISGTPIERELIGALAAIKGAAAAVNADLGVLDGDVARAIGEAAAAVGRGDWDEHFPIDVFQTGSGTSSNMNTNEVIATLATESLGSPVHPNDHVNASQSSNDVFPSAIHIAATRAIVRTLIPALQHLEASLSRKAEEFAEVVKSGRTHLMDATPVTLGQEFGGYAAAIRYGVERLEASLPRIGELPLGGTAVGTGINTPPGFSAAIIEQARRRARPAAHRGARPLRGAELPRRAGRGVRPAAHHRRRPGQDRQRPALDGLRPAHRPRRDLPARPAARAARSCRAR